VSGALGHHPVTDVYSADDGGLADVGDGPVVVGGLVEVGKHAVPGGVVRIPFPPGDRFQGGDAGGGQDAEAVLLAPAHGPRPQGKVALRCLDVEGVRVRRPGPVRVIRQIMARKTTQKRAIILPNTFLETDPVIAELSFSCWGVLVVPAGTLLDVGSLDAWCHASDRHGRAVCWTAR